MSDVEATAALGRAVERSDASLDSALARMADAGDRLEAIARASGASARRISDHAMRAVRPPTA
jgi:hypothetical protein